MENFYELQSKVLPSLNGALSKGHAYFTGPQISWVDLLICCELYQIQSTYSGWKVPDHLNYLCDWYDKMLELDQIKKVNAELDNLLKENDLREPKPELPDENI